MRKSVKTLFGFLIVLCLPGFVFLAGCDRLNPAPDTTRPVSAPLAQNPAPTSSTIATQSTAKVKRTDLAALLKLRGRVVAKKEVPLFFRQPGWIKSLNIKIGDQVDKGALLAEEEDLDLEERIHAAKVALESARTALIRAQLPAAPTRSAVAAQDVAAAQSEVDVTKAKLDQLKASLTADDLTPYRNAVEQARLEVTKAQTDYDKYAYLHGFESSPEGRELYAANLRHQNAQAALARVLRGPRPEEIAVVEADVKSREAILQSAKAVFDYELLLEQSVAVQRQTAIRAAQSDVRSREDEVVRLQNRADALKLLAPFAGSIVSLDAQLGDKVNPFQSVGVLADPSEIEIEVEVSQEDMLRVSQGLEVQVVMDGYPNQNYKAKVSQIPSKPILWQGKEVYQVHLQFSDTAKPPATIRMGSDVTIPVMRSKVLVVPVAALAGDEAKRYVEVPSDNGTRKVSVGVGLTSDADAEILSGLREGDTVVVPPAR